MNRLYDQANAQLTRLKGEYVGLKHTSYLKKEERRKLAELKDKIAQLNTFLDNILEATTEQQLTEQRKHNVHDTRITGELFNSLTSNQDGTHK